MEVVWSRWEGPLASTSGAFRLEMRLLGCNYLLMGWLRWGLDVHVGAVVNVNLLGNLLVYCTEGVDLGLHLLKLVHVYKESLLLSDEVLLQDGILSVGILLLNSYIWSSLWKSPHKVVVTCQIKTEVEP